MDPMYIAEEVVWKCQKHPSKRHRNGVCPVCLRDRLLLLCPHCAKILPCSCYAASSSSSSSASSSSSFSLFPTLSNRQPTLRRSRSIAVPHVFSRFAVDTDRQAVAQFRRPKSKMTWFLSKFTIKSSRNRAEEMEKNVDGVSNKIDKYVCRSRMSCASVDDFAKTMMKSRSVHMVMTTSRPSVQPQMVEKGWSFPSPMTIFRHSSKSNTSASEWV